MALASRNAGEERQSVAIIGDGGLTAGLAYEGLCHLGDSGANVLVVLNDNRMSISPNVGAMTKYLTRLLAGSAYDSVHKRSEWILNSISSGIRELAVKMEKHVKGMFVPGVLFEELGLRYYGPVDGHDFPELLEIIKQMKKHTGPRILHVVTCKGRGYQPAEEDQVGYHAVPSGFDPEIGVVKSSKKPDAAKTYYSGL